MCLEYKINLLHRSLIRLFIDLNLEIIHESKIRVEITDFMHIIFSL
jgi:hypothetical protein